MQREFLFISPAHMHVLYHKHDLEQGSMAKIAFQRQQLDQLIKREVLMLLCLQRNSFNLSDSLPERGAFTQLNTNWQRIDEKSDIAFNFLTTSIRYRRAYNNVALPCITIEKNSIGSERHHVEGNVFLPAP
ncbi:hypothetical protein D3C78_693950 [compost metagenome]